MLFSKHNKEILLGMALFFIVEVSWALAFFAAPVDRIQGQVYRIMYLHVPAAFTAFLTAFLMLIVSLKSLLKKDNLPLYSGKAIAEVGLVFTALTLATGSIWGRPTWGVYWTWDARLTTTLLLALLYAGYLLLYNSFNPGTERNKACAVLGILIAACVPIVYQSVNWWRTLHQPQSILRPGGSTMTDEILYILLFSVFAMLCFGGWMVKFRIENLKLRESLEAEMMRNS